MWRAFDYCVIPGGIVVVDKFIHPSTSFIGSCEEVLSQELHLHCLEEGFYVTILLWRFIPDISMLDATSLQPDVELPAPKAAVIIRLYCSRLAIGVDESLTCLYDILRLE